MSDCLFCDNLSAQYTCPYHGGGKERFTLEEIKANATLHETLDNIEPPVLIYSREHNAWWRPNGAGYTMTRSEAGIYQWATAWRTTNHCGPEKKIEYHLVRQSHRNATEARSSMMDALRNIKAAALRLNECQCYDAGHRCPGCTLAVESLTSASDTLIYGLNTETPEARKAAELSLYAGQPLQPQKEIDRLVQEIDPAVTHIKTPVGPECFCGQDFTFP